MNLKHVSFICNMVTVLHVQVLAGAKQFCASGSSKHSGTAPFTGTADLPVPAIAIRHVCNPLKLPLPMDVGEVPVHDVQHPYSTTGIRAIPVEGAYASALLDSRVALAVPVYQSPQRKLPHARSSRVAVVASKGTIGARTRQSESSLDRIV